jgi:hypothetical protein
MQQSQEDAKNPKKNKHLARGQRLLVTHLPVELLINGLFLMYADYATLMSTFCLTLPTKIRACESIRVKHLFHQLPSLLSNQRFNCALSVS